MCEREKMLQVLFQSFKAGNAYIAPNIKLEVISYFTAINDLHLLISKLMSWFVELKLCVNYIAKIELDAKNKKSHVGLKANNLILKIVTEPA